MLPAIFATLWFTPFEISAHWLPFLTTITGNFGSFAAAVVVVVVAVVADALPAVSVAVVAVTAVVSRRVGGDFLDFFFLLLLVYIAPFSSSQEVSENEVVLTKKFISYLLCWELVLLDQCVYLPFFRVAVSPFSLFTISFSSANSCKSLLLINLSIAHFSVAEFPFFIMKTVTFIYRSILLNVWLPAFFINYII